MDHLRRFYAEAYVEDVRLTRSPHGRLEFARTVELLERVLPAPPARVLDVGGGTGIHARWLAEAGYDVTLIDLMREHVAAGGGDRRGVRERRRRALAGARRRQLRRRAAARAALSPRRGVGSAAALREAARVARPGALVAVAAIGRYAGLLDLGCPAGLTPATEPIVAGDPRDRPPRSAARVHHRVPAPARGAFGRARRRGAADVEVYGVEGPAGPALDAHGIDAHRRLPAAAMRCARIAERDPALLAASAHLLGLARTPSGARTPGAAPMP